MTTGIHVTGGLRERITFYVDGRGLIELWRTGKTYTLETPAGTFPVGTSDASARDAFERAVETFSESPMVPYCDCGDYCAYCHPEMC